MIPDSEFTNDFEYMESAHVMYQNYILYYDLKKCINCGAEWWQKKEFPIQTELCVKCRKEELGKMNLGII